MTGGLARARDLLRLAFTGRGRRMWSAVTYRLYSNSVSVGLRRDLRAPCSPPPRRQAATPGTPAQPRRSPRLARRARAGPLGRAGVRPLGPGAPAAFRHRDLPRRRRARRQGVLHAMADSLERE